MTVRFRLVAVAALVVCAAIPLPARAQPAEADVRFMQGMIPHHAQALPMSRLARTRTESESLLVLADRIATGLGVLVGDGRPLLAIATMFLVSTAATQIIGGQVSALLVGPVALAVAQSKGIALHPMAIAVAIGASTAFLTPIAHPVNAMMMGTGGYRRRDFARVGAGMTVVTLFALLVGLWLFWGVR